MKKSYHGDSGPIFQEKKRPCEECRRHSPLLLRKVWFTPEKTPLRGNAEGTRILEIPIKSYKKEAGGRLKGGRRPTKNVQKKSVNKKVLVMILPGGQNDRTPRESIFNLSKKATAAI